MDFPGSVGLLLLMILRAAMASDSPAAVYVVRVKGAPLSTFRGHAAPDFTRSAFTDLLTLLPMGCLERQQEFELGKFNMTMWCMMK